MRRRRVSALLAGAVAGWVTGALAVTGAAAAGPGSAPLPVPAASAEGGEAWAPGPGALNASALTGQDLFFLSVSCGSAGNCAAGGYY
jgi:hypothetical protein